jgi:hypothetical protein
LQVQILLGSPFSAKKVTGASVVTFRPALPTSNRVIGFLSLFILSLVRPAFAAGPSHQYFDRRVEFPNYFLSAADRARPWREIPKASIDEIKPALQAAVYSKLRRMVIPVLPEGATRPIRVRYYDYLYKVLRAIDPTVELIPVGGTVRSVISVIYEELYFAMQKTPHASAAEILRKISTEKGDIAAGDLLGVGSDLDSLFRNSDSLKTSQIEKRATEVTNSVIERFSYSEDSETMRRVFFIRGDVKEYYSQMHRNLAQGGSELDHLGFSMQSGTFFAPYLGRASEPIVDDLIRGNYRVLPPTSLSAIEDQGKVINRVPRPLTEIPFLEIHPDDVKYFESALTDLTRDIKNGNLLSEKAFEQFSKILRNSRFNGAHNRLYRAAPGSPEAAFKFYTEQIPELHTVHTGRRANQIIPEFVDSFLIDGSRRGLNGLPESLLMKSADFIERYTDHGVVYHGTSQAAGIVILRGGMYISSDSQGRDLDGRGGYVTHDLNRADTFGFDGVVLGLRLKPDVVDKINVLDMNDPLVVVGLRKYQDEAARRGIELNQLLAREHGIDYIQAGAGLVQNTAIFNLPKNAEELLGAYANRYSASSFSLITRINAGVTYETFGSYLKIQGAEVAPLKGWNDILNEGLLSAEIEVRSAAIRAIDKMAPEGIQFDRSVWENLKIIVRSDPDQKVAFRAFDALFESHSNDVQIRRSLEEWMFREDGYWMHGAGDFIGKNFDRLIIAQPGFIADLPTLVKKADVGFKNYLGIALRGAEPSPFFTEVINVLVNDTNDFIRAEGYHLLAKPGLAIDASIVATIESGLVDRNEAIRVAASEALKNIDLRQFSGLDERLQAICDAESSGRVKRFITSTLLAAKTNLTHCSDLLMPVKNSS